MSKIRVRPETGKLYFDFHFRGKRCREYSTLADTPANRKAMEAALKKIEAEITLGTFNYSAQFPSSKHAAQFASAVPAATIVVRQAEATHPSTGMSVAMRPSFRDFATVWWNENEVRWRAGTKDTNKGIVLGRLASYFDARPVDTILKPDILAYRAELAKEPGRTGNEFLSAKTINGIVTTLCTIMAEAADRYGFPNPGGRIKRLKAKRPEIFPFTLEEARLLISTIRADFRNYVLVRLLTAMRSGEANGLKWSRIDWERRQILIRETFTHGRWDYTKTDGSQREIDMSDEVYRALKEQHKLTGKGELVFANNAGQPIDAKNFANRVWAPLLRLLKLKPRRPNQMRHTCATLWLAAGENPEWIARQMGHSTTEMLFRVYSRFVPNLTRKDGSAFARMVSAALTQPTGESSNNPNPNGRDAKSAAPSTEVSS